MAKTGEYLPKAYIRGSIVPYEEATLPLSTSALQYGIGCFAGIRGYKQADGGLGIFRLADHAKRMAQSTQLLHFSKTITASEIENKIIELAKANQPKTDTYIRPFYYKSDTNLGPSLTGEFDLGIYMLELDEYLDTAKGLSVGVSSWIRVPDHAIPARSKATGVYINAALAIEEAAENGLDASIMLDHQGNVTEGSVMNLFIVRDGKLITPALGGDLLEGITRRSIIELADKMGIEVIERIVRRSELYAADEAFFTGTATEVAWISAVDRRPVSQEVGPVTTRLKEAFSNVVRGSTKGSNSWLTII